LNIEVVKNAALKFLNSDDYVSIEPLGQGLINQTFKITAAPGLKSFVLQAINSKIFLKPEDILFNYKLVYDTLTDNHESINIPEPIAARNGALLWKDDHDIYWRATAYIANSYSPSIATDENKAFSVANCFAKFTSALSTLQIYQLREIIPGFHNLSFRYEQFESAIKRATVDNLIRSTFIISELRNRKKFVDFYLVTCDSSNYPSRVMHHDCKINNILFEKISGKMICPVDLDTVMPGKFFSDLGDMLRTMTCPVDENSTDWEKINVRPDFYKATLEGYLSGARNIFQEEELTNIHYSGMLLTYMQCLRFVTDYLLGNIYYRIDYEEQNLNRALNQLMLLKRMEEFLRKEYPFFQF
jgi:thiamine kinase-like enzyme